MKKRMATAVALIALLLISGCATAQPRLSLAGVAPGDTIGGVTSKLGAPRKVLASEGFTAVVYEYRKFSISFDEDGTVTGIEAASADFCVNGAVCPGMPLTTLRKRVRDLVATDRSKNRYQGWFGVDGCWVEVETVNDAVKKVAVLCQP